VKCIHYKSIFNGFTERQGSIISVIISNINRNVHKNNENNNLKCKNEEPRFIHPKISSIKNKVIFKELKLRNYYYKAIVIIIEVKKNGRCNPKSSHKKSRRRHTRRKSEKSKNVLINEEQSKSKSHPKLNVIKVQNVCSVLMYCIIKMYNCSKRTLLLSGDIELNPGPTQKNDNKTSKLRIMSYNIQGLGGHAKLKRVNNILHKLDHRDSYVISLQETHFKNESTINYHWKWGVVQSLGKSNSCGVAILYSKSYFDEIIESRKDSEGRYCCITLVKDGELYSFLNLYAPNNHYNSLNYIKYIETEIEDIFVKYPLTNMVINGDLNFVISPQNDSIGRNQTQQEKIVVDKFKEILLKYNLIDSFRAVNCHGGYTWGKNNPMYIRSRIDYIFAGKNLCNRISSSYVTYSFNESDHNPVTSEFSIDMLINGPGIIRGNSTLLEKPEIKERVEHELKNILNEMPSNWNPHQILDYYKYNLRLLLLKEGKKKAVIDRSRLEQANLEIGRLNKQLDIKLQIIKDHDKNDTLKEDILIDIENIKEAIKISEYSTKDLKDEEARKLIFRSRAKWSELGEKSNKYFLNLVKERQRKMQIRKITSCGISYFKQDEISKAIEKFYKDLYKKQPHLKKMDLSDPMFQNLPSLSSENATMLKANLTLDELFVTLNTCNESAPGPDGISYDAYKHLWNISGPLILNAWNYSNQIGITSLSQRESVITLLDKKGKDRTKIENLRPISLSNCDIKLCTKALALRTSKVIHTLVDKNQTGYIPGRQVTDNIRLLEEIIEEASKIKKEAYLITLDAQKAFDSVDHDYLINILELYKFPQEYINWIKLLYKDLNACVLVNGYTTSRFKIEQSVKQGDALSCILFILAIEPLIQSIKQNPLIEPISIKSNTSNETDEITSATYADDITAVTGNKDSIQEIINEYEKFSTYSGVNLNVKKTEVLILGKDKFNPVEFKLKSKGQTISIFSQESVKICGITLSNNKEISYKDNVTNKIIKLERQLDVWKARNLTLQGKMLIVKTFGISQLIYSFQSTHIKENELKLIDNIIFRFIWNIKKSNPISSGKIKRDIMKSGIEEGGLNAPDISNINNSIKYKHFLKHIENSQHPLHKIYNNYKNDLLVSFRNFETGNGAQTYIGTAINTHRRIGKLLHRDLKAISSENEGIHKNYFAYIQNNELVNNPFTNINQQAMITRLITYNIQTFGDLYKEKQLSRFPNLFLDVFQIFNTYPIEWRTLITKSNRNHRPIEYEIPIYLNKWQKVNSLTIKHISKYLNTSIRLESIDAYLIRKHRISQVDHHIYQNIKNPFLELKKTTTDMKLKNVQFKILHNIYPTMKHLYIWKIKETPNCNHCGIEETLKHAIYDCEIARNCWAKFAVIFGQHNINLKYEDILLGTRSRLSILNSINDTERSALDTILILIKQRLILQREEKRNLLDNELHNLIMNWVKIERYNAIKNNKELKFNKKWKWLEDILIQINVQP